MRLLLFVLASAATLSLPLAACSDDASPGGPVSDAAPAEGGGDVREGGVLPPVDASTRHCTLDNGGDPVALCTQKAVLKSERAAAFAKTLGVAQSWDSKTFLPDQTDGGVTLHDVHDDVAFASTIVSYDTASRVYGDSEINVDLDNVLVLLATNIENQLPAPPSEYGGDFYRRLRNIAGGLRYINENDHANKMDALAEPFGRALFTSYVQTVSTNDTVLGTPSGGNVAYLTADVASGAHALLDMAFRHASDDPMAAAKWVKAAKQSFDHLFSRARDPVTHLFYRSLVTSSDVDHDALAPVDALPVDAELTEVQASVMLALLRANELYIANPTLFAQFAMYELTDRADQVFKAMLGVGLWDARDRGYLEGWLPSQSALLTNKTTRGNALMFAAIHRKFIDAPPRDAGADTPEVVQLKGLRTLLIQQQPDHSSLLSVVADQSSFLRASTRDYNLATLYTIVGGTVDGGTVDGGTVDGGTVDGGDGGSDAGVDGSVTAGAVEPRAASYTAAATAVALEALSEQYYGVK